MIRRIYSLVVKELIHLRRDWWLPVFMVVGGALELLLVGWATSRPITNLPLMVLDHDRSAASHQIVSALENTTTFNLETWADDLEQIEEAMLQGTINAAVVIPHGFSADLADPRGRPQIMVILNGSESVAATAALRSVDGLIRSQNQAIAVERLRLPPEAVEGFAPSVRVWFNEALSEALYTTPAELALMLEFTVLIFAALSFSRERELGTLEQLLVMPFTSAEIIIGKAIPALLLSFVNFIVMLTMVRLAFDVPMRGSGLLLIIIASGYLMVELGKGMVVSVSARTQHQAFLAVMLVGMVDFMFTGYAAPVESMPQVLQWFANFVPAHHWLTILRGIMLKGIGLETLWPNVLALVGLGAVIGTASTAFVRRALD